MNDVKRYDTPLSPNPNGPWVRYDDYKALVDRLNSETIRADHLERTRADAEALAAERLKNLANEKDTVHAVESNYAHALNECDRLHTLLQDKNAELSEYSSRLDALQQSQDQVLRDGFAAIERDETTIRELQSRLDRVAQVLDVLRISKEPLTSRPILIGYLESALKVANPDAEVVNAPAKSSQSFIGDGFGNEWPTCGRDDCGLQVVRPGKVSCEDDQCPRVVENRLSCWCGRDFATTDDCDAHRRISGHAVEKCGKDAGFMKTCTKPKGHEGHCGFERVVESPAERAAVVRGDRFVEDIKTLTGAVENQKSDLDSPSAQAIRETMAQGSNGPYEN